MATDLRTTYGAVVESSSSTADSITCDTNREYTIHHTGINNAGVAAANNVILGLNAAPTAYDNTAQTNKLILQTTVAITVGPGVSSIYHKTMTAGAPMLNVSVSGSDVGNH